MQRLLSCTVFAVALGTNEARCEEPAERLKIKEWKTRHCQKCKGGKRETGKSSAIRWVENVGLEKAVPYDGWKMRDWKKQCHTMGGIRGAGKARSRVGNRETGKCGISVSGVENAGLNSMERRKFKTEHTCTVNNKHT